MYTRAKFLQDGSRHVNTGKSWTWPKNVNVMQKL